MANHSPVFTVPEYLRQPENATTVTSDSQETCQSNTQTDSSGFVIGMGDALSRQQEKDALNTHSANEPNIHSVNDPNTHYANKDERVGVNFENKQENQSDKNLSGSLKDEKQAEEANAEPQKTEDEKSLLEKTGEVLDNFADKVQEFGKDIAIGAGEVAGEIAMGVLGIQKAHAGTMPDLHKYANGQPENQQADKDLSGSQKYDIDKARDEENEWQKQADEKERLLAEQRATLIQQANDEENERLRRQDRIEQGFIDDKPVVGQTENQEDKANTISKLNKRPTGTAREYVMADGSIQIRTGGTVSWRNNNPGNLKFEYKGTPDPKVKSNRTYEKALKDAQRQYDGIIDLDQWGYPIFATEELGKTAQAKLVLQRHKDKTIPEMLKKYAIEDYVGKPNYDSYASTIYKTGDSMGVDLRGSRKIGELSDEEKQALLKGMIKHEGSGKGNIKVIPAKKK